MNKKADLIDRYGELDTEIKKLKKQLEEVKTDLNITVAGKYEGSDYIITAIERTAYEYDTKKIFKVLGEKTFLQCCKIAVTEVKNFIAPAELQKYITDVITGITLIPKRKGNK